jgi:hypothetical protein
VWSVRQRSLQCQCAAGSRAHTPSAVVRNGGASGGNGDAASEDHTTLDVRARLRDDAIEYQRNVDVAAERLDNPAAPNIDLMDEAPPLSQRLRCQFSGVQAVETFVVIQELNTVLSDRL